VKKTLRIVAVLEAISFLVLLVATVVKETGGTERGVKLMGPLHGVLFLVYALLVLLVASDEKWRLKRTLLTLLCAVLPFGGFVADAKLIGPAEGERAATA
jgi:integral membrane protein